jgi:hypothetical protein
MFLGHFGLALGTKRAAPRTSLGALTFAAQFADELWPILLLLGVERATIVRGMPGALGLEFTYYPFSHSLLLSIVWGVLIGGAYYTLRRDARAALVIGLLVVSHWFLDLPMHVRDLPLWPGASSPKVGWGIWHSIAATYVIEFTIFAGGLWAYLRATRARDRVGRWGLWAYVLVLAAIYVASNGPPPPSERVLAWSSLAIWVFPVWAWWVDKHRYYAGRVQAPNVR